MQDFHPAAGRRTAMPGLWILLTCLLLAACAGGPGAQHEGPLLSGPRLDAPAGPAWFALRFRHAWPAGSDPRWEQDLLLAETVVGPTLRANEDRLVRWRFHRRAARTPSGHQFSFIFYSDGATAARIHEEVRANPTLVRMMRTGLVEELRLDDTGDTDLAATSDPEWPPHIQKYWPLFIMGASAVWLELVGACNAEDALQDSLDALLVHYRDCHAQVTKDWRRWGQHAYLHHLSGVFGYPPMLIRKEIRF